LAVVAYQPWLNGEQGYFFAVIPGRREAANYDAQSHICGLVLTHHPGMTAGRQSCAAKIR
jgi:hypothetical protein